MLWVQERKLLAFLSLSSHGQILNRPESGRRARRRAKPLNPRPSTGRTAQAKAAWTGGQPLQAEGNKEDGKEGSERARH